MIAAGACEAQPRRATAAKMPDSGGYSTAAQSRSSVFER